uniref:Uncharacterized protein n=1 Tax=Noctiluca scintillans TaxID=2966 RepID=A0A7S1AY28_NOCSC
MLHPAANRAVTDAGHSASNPDRASVSSSRKQRERRRRRETTTVAHHKNRKVEGEQRPEEGKRRRRSRSRKRERQRDPRQPENGSHDPQIQSYPPMDWRGPAMEPRPPPAEWRGPGDRDWRSSPHSHGPHAHHGFPVPRAEWSRQMQFQSRMPFPQRPGLHTGPRPDYAAWHAMQRPDDGGRYRADPLVDWRGPANMSRPYGPRGPSEAEMWGARPPLPSPAPCSQDVPSTRGPAREGSPSVSQQPSVESRPDIPVAEIPLAASEEEAPDPRRTAECLQGVRIMRSLLSEKTVAKLRAAGVSVDSNEVGSTDVREEAPAAAVHSRCSRLGLDSSRARLPPPMPGPPRLPVGIVEPSNDAGLWEKFRQLSGTPLPAGSSAIPCELRTSRGGGHVVVPIVVGP